ncbi:MAG TPA: hypothetical protein PLU43_09755 [Lachnospiraceae bacterium]|nr:hypothetical protein [Lachnospiraceae bacterium]
MKRIIIKITSVFLLFCTLTYITVNAAAGDEETTCLTTEQYQQMEKDSVQTIKEVLSAHCFSDSGVMLTKENRDGKLYCYHIQIHHGRFAGLEKEEKEMLKCLIEQSLQDVWEIPVEAYFTSEDAAGLLDCTFFPSTVS